MRNKVLLAVALAAFMAAPAFAAVQNVKVSGDIDSTYLNRNHFSFGLRGAGVAVESGLAEQSVFITQTRVRIDADLSDNVSTTVGLINERAWQSESTGGSATNVDLYLAYATMREFLYSPLTVSVGRQIFSYGNGLIMGDGGVNNIASAGGLTGVANDLTKRTSYDGIKAILDYKPLTIDLIYFKNDQRILTGAVDSNKTNSDVWGINANYQLGDAMNTVVEGYFFARQNGDRYLAGTNGDKGDQLYVPGLRVSTNPIKGLNVQGELAFQGGRLGTTSANDNIRREAMAYQVLASYTLPVLEKYKPLVSASYTHVSGDKNGGDDRSLGGTPASNNVYTAWDPFNEAQGGGTIYNSIFDLTNLNIISVTGQVTPLEDVTASLTWSNLFADRKTTGTAGANPLIFRDPSVSAAAPTFGGATTGRKDMGNEFDANVNYAYTEDVTLGLSLGWYVPGKMFTSANNSTASQALAHVLVNF